MNSPSASAPMDKTAAVATPSGGRSPFVAAVVTGQIAGLVMAVVVVLVFTVVYGTTVFYPLQVIGSFAFGEDALVGTNVPAVVAGLIFHQAGPSLLWGLVFGAIAAKRRLTNGTESLLVGLGVGVVSMVGPYLLIPALMNALHDVDIWNREVPTGWDWAAHLVFGASFGLFPVVLDGLTKKTDA